MSWHQLPPNLQSRILDEVVSGPSPGDHVVARCAAVCKDWQRILERKIWQRLTLTQSCLEEFANAISSTPYRRSYIQHIHLRIELPRYACVDCGPAARHSVDHDIEVFKTAVTTLSALRARRVDSGAAAIDPHVDPASEVFKTAVVELFALLGTWEPSSCPQGILLEVSIVSPSDAEHYFQADVRLDASGWAMDPASARAPSNQNSEAPHDPVHGWVRGRQVNGPRLNHLDTIFLRGVYPKFAHHDITPVSVVRSFLLRRQTRRSVGSEALQAIFAALPRLETSVHEPWRPFLRVAPRGAPRGYFHDTDYYKAMPLSFPPTLRHVVVFEDFNQDFDQTYTYSSDPFLQPELVRQPSASVSRAWALASTSLVTLSASYIVDAVDFFLPSALNITTGTWDRLESLVLTSLVLRGESPQHEVATLMTLAGRSALFMPKLRTLELWYGARRIASVFRYHVRAGRAAIAWRGTCRFDMTKWPQVDEVWQRVSVLHTAQGLAATSHQSINEADVKSHAEAVTRLDIRTMVAHPASLEEIKREGGRYSTCQLEYHLSQLPLRRQLRIRLHLHPLRRQQQLEYAGL